MLKMQTEEILQQEMDRKMFLKTTGFAIIGLVGVTALLKRFDVFGAALTKNATPNSTTVNAQSGLTYGRSSYGV